MILCKKMYRIDTVIKLMSDEVELQYKQLIIII